MDERNEAVRYLGFCAGSSWNDDLCQYLAAGNCVTSIMMMNENEYQCLTGKHALSKTKLKQIEMNFYNVLVDFVGHFYFSPTG